MKKLIKKFKKPEFKAAAKSYLRAVLASAVTMGIALATDVAPEYAVLVGGITAPLIKWADKAEEDFGLKYDKASKKK
jgi:Flp pilus assembly pilin Flp